MAQYMHGVINQELRKEYNICSSYSIVAEFTNLFGYYAVLPAT
jgi:hypothetical protein